MSTPSAEHRTCTNTTEVDIAELPSSETCRQELTQQFDERRRAAGGLTQRSITKCARQERGVRRYAPIPSMRLRLVPHNGRGGGDEAQRELARKVPFDKHPAASDVALAIRTLFVLRVRGRLLLVRQFWSGPRTMKSTRMPILWAVRYHV